MPDAVTKRYLAAVDKTRPARMKWWNEARYGMFVHWGLYAQIARNEWVMNFEAWEKDEYDAFADTWKPRPGAPREWAKLAVKAGMKYMVLTTKHHEGFCLWDTQQTDFNAVKRGPHRDLVGEFVDACREFGLKVGFYYSLMDWRHEDGMRCGKDEAARRRFVDFTHSCVRELMTNYGKVDILWYDVSWPLSKAEQWESVTMNGMARKLQPHILINDRSQIPEDFNTPEGQVKPSEAGRGWEACMMSDETSWGYMPSAAADTVTPRDILRMLATASANQGNLLLNVGPAPDGTIPTTAAEPLLTVGKWLKLNGEAVYGRLDRNNLWGSACGISSLRGNTSYFWCRNWPGREIRLGNYPTKLKKVSFLVSGKEIQYEQRAKCIILKNLPPTSPDKLAGVTIIKLDFARKPEFINGGATTMALGL
ncbi:MAG: alpha-L-fucosidase [Planctomycetaceae bacterium]|nr:alpha-L-fucosidase [Planctomycetaceae bacterium]